MYICVRTEYIYTCTYYVYECDLCIYIYTMLVIHNSEFVCIRVFVCVRIVCNVRIIYRISIICQKRHLTQNAFCQTVPSRPVSSHPRVRVFIFKYYARYSLYLITSLPGHPWLDSHPWFPSPVRRRLGGRSAIRDFRLSSLQSFSSPNPHTSYTIRVRNSRPNTYGATNFRVGSDHILIRWKTSHQKWFRGQHTTLAAKSNRVSLLSLSSRSLYIHPFSSFTALKFKKTCHIHPVFNAGYT